MLISYSFLVHGIIDLYGLVIGKMLKPELSVSKKLNNAAWNMLILISDFATELDDGEVCNPGPITPVQVITCFSHFFCFHFEFQYIFYFFLFPFARFLFILIYIGHFSKIMKLFVLYLFYSNLVLALKTFKH